MECLAYFVVGVLFVVLILNLIPPIKKKGGHKWK